MKEKVLIVEDEFIEASYLRGMLERAGYNVCGIARTVEKALELVAREKPGLALLDIFLSGKGTGIDLAKQLKERDIAFVYLSANSDERVLTLAKATEPYGFLVKPFRENDLLVTLEIARYRHEHSLESKLRREAIVQQQLEHIAGAGAEWKVKLLAIGKALQPYITFDLLKVTSPSAGGGDQGGISFLRVGFDEYQEMDGNEPKITTGMGSSLTLPLPLSNGESFSFSFFSRRADSYNAEHTALFGRLQPALAKSIVRPVKMTAMEQKSPAPSGFEGIIGKSHLLLNVFDNITQVAPTDTSILILGESGTGKEMIASCIHKLSRRKDQRLVKVNCASIPPTLIESELFGHEKGAFTGAIDKRIGKFEQADKGTIFLDEVGEMPLELQAKLLHVLQDKEIERIGSRAPTKVDVRVIAATNRHLEKEVAEGRFRLDLYYRLNVIPITLPSLRERKEDLPELAHYFIDMCNRKAGKKITGLSDKATKNMMAYHWPGNIRELEHLIERCVLLSKSTVIEDIPVHLKADAAPGNPAPGIKTIQENERDHIIAVLKKCKGKIWGPGAAAEMLNLPPTTLRSKMKKLGIDKSLQ